MSPAGNVLAVIRFELRRACSRGRLLWWVVLAGFPILLTLLIISVPKQSGVEPPREMWATILFLLCPMAVSMLGTFLYAAPAVSVELERKSWAYLAVRPHASTAVMLGKYLVAVLWAGSAACAGLTVSLLIARPDDMGALWWAMVRLIGLSCPAYGAAYLLLGTLFYKRAMIACIAYTLLFELAASFIPAIVNKFTIQFRLRGLFLQWAKIDVSSTDGLLLQLLGNSPPWVHVVILAGYTLVLLILAQIVLRWSEFTIADEATT